MLGSLPPPVEQRIARVEVGRESEVSLLLDDGVRARLGSRDAIDRKLGLLKSILEETTANGWRVREIDVRNVDQPLVRLPAGLGAVQVVAFFVHVARSSSLNTPLRPRHSAN
jgi:cell division septal protein FtsQ